MRRAALPPEIRLRRIGRRDCAAAVDEMRAYTDSRTEDSPDEIWLVEHPPVFTLGQAGRRAHVHAPGRVPVIATDRGGQVTYHGPGQAVVYVLLDLRRLGLGVRGFVHDLEQAAIDAVGHAGVAAGRRPGAPGVYVGEAKLAALGLRVRRGCTYHGIAVNVDLDLAPFRGIDPCGYEDLEVTRLRDLGVAWTVEETGERVAREMMERIVRRQESAPQKTMRLEQGRRMRRPYGAVPGRA